MRSVSDRDPSPRCSSASRSSSSRSSGVISTATGPSDNDGAESIPKCAVRYQVPAGMTPQWSMPAGIHSPMVGVMVHVREPMVAVDAPRSFHSNSCVGCECASKRVSRETSSSMPAMTNGTSISPAS